MLMLIPVLKYLQSVGYDVQVVGLTTAAAALRNAGFSPLGFKDILRSDEERARNHGARLAGEMHQPGKVNSLEESIAYLGLSYADLEDQLGEEGAREAFQQQGRQAFLPRGPMRRFFDALQPDVVLTTNSPRAELASIQVAAERGVPSVGVLDLFGLGSHNDIPADYVCVPFQQAADNLIRRGIRPEALRVTGNPNFDWVHQFSENTSQAADWRKAHGIGSEDLLALFAMKPVWDEKEELIVGSLERVLPDKPELKIALRPHPNGDTRLADNVIARLGSSAFVDDKTALPVAIDSCDALITHKSTVAVEAALLGRQVALFHTDRDYSTHAIPLSLYDWSSLSITVEEGVETLKAIQKETRQAQEERGKQIREAWNCDGNCPQRIAEVVIQAIESGSHQSAA
ncbi:hypothetical protein [Gimesia sp.]|uniref:hypothetical protein n=1 Tax=Gimesia sp. TaxID=2024833 RepID=UPI0032EAC345